jgi:23S rRNA (adenine2503-C2)-methyltransferase
MATLIYDLDLNGLEALLVSWGEPAYRARQIWQGLYQNLWQNAGEFTTLPKSLRQKLGENILFEVLKPTIFLDSTDGKTRKTLFQMQDGQQIEAVLMRYERRRTLCISTQVGCAMGCVFCATGQMGFRRHLSSGEIVAQVMYYAHLLQKEDQQVTNVVVMGMGEPLGYNFGARRFTISTVGLAPMIRRFADEKRQVNLAISLHAAEDGLRGSMLPVNRKYDIDEVLDACRYYVAQTNRRITFEWALIHGVNDTPEQARLLIGRLKGMLCHVNAIPLNPTTGYSGQPTSRERAKAFKEILEQAGISCTIRMRRGIDIQAGCGQLASRA